jgi:hypothetical protein
VWIRTPTMATLLIRLFDMLESCRFKVWKVCCTEKMERAGVMRSLSEPRGPSLYTLDMSNSGHDSWLYRLDNADARPQVVFRRSNDNILPQATEGP